jgi:hypothetical protein
VTTARGPAAKPGLLHFAAAIKDGILAKMLISLVRQSADVEMLPDLIKSDPNKTTEEILRDIHDVADKDAPLVNVPIAALHVKLSRDADRTASKLLKATYLLLAVTIILVLIESFKMYGAAVIRGL